MLPKSRLSKPIFGHPVGSTKMGWPHRKQLLSSSHAAKVIVAIGSSSNLQWERGVPAPAGHLGAVKPGSRTMAAGCLKADKSGTVHASSQRRQDDNKNKNKSFAF